MKTCDKETLLITHVTALYGRRRRGLDDGSRAWLAVKGCPIIVMIDTGDGSGDEIMTTLWLQI